MATINKGKFPVSTRRNRNKQTRRDTITKRKHTGQMLLEQKNLLELIASGHSIEECLTELIRAVARLLPHIRASILLADSGQTRFPILYAADIPSSLGACLKSTPINNLSIGTRGTTVYSGEPMSCVDIAHDEYSSQMWRDLCVAHGILACHSTPVINPAGEPIASLMLCFDEARAPSKWELHIAEFGTHIASIAIERDRTMQALRDSEAKLTEELDDTKQLQNISSQLIQEDHIDILYQQILDATIALTHSDIGSMQMLYPEKNELHLLAWKGFDPASATFWQRVGLDPASTCGVALHTGKRVIIPDVESCDFMAGTDDLVSYRLSNIKAAQSIPLIARSGRIVGMISNHWRQPHQPSERELHLLDVLARQAADLIERRQTEEALRQSEQQLKELDQRKDEFIGIASHELKTPLSSIKGYVQLLERVMKDTKNERANDYLAKTSIYINRLNSLIADLLDISKIQVGKLQMNMSSFDFDALVKDSIESIQHSATHHRIEIIGQAETEITGDRNRLEQVLINLLTNAIKYSPDANSVSVTINRNEDSVQVSVQDYGIGIPANRQAKIFERFYQVESGTRDFSGLGIGLYLSWEIVSRHGGTISVSSEEGKGSIFTFTLPVKQAGSERSADEGKAHSYL